MKLCLTQLLAIGTIFASVPALAQTYTVQDLGAAPGQTVSMGTDLNDLGQACGDSGTNGVLFSDGKVISLTISGAGTVANGIDNSGVVVGASSDTATTHALIWSGGTVQDITDTSLFPFGESQGHR